MTVQTEIEAQLAAERARCRGAARGGRRRRHGPPLHRPSRRRHARALRARHPRARDVRERYALEVSSPGIERPLTKPDHFRRYLGRRARVRTRGDTTAATPSPASSSAQRHRGHARRRHGGRADPLRRHQPFPPRRGVAHEPRDPRSHARARREKGIATDKLHDALEDALQSAYKKQPGAAKYARVELDDDTGDFRVFELIVPEELEDQLLEEAVERRAPSTPRRAR